MKAEEELANAKCELGQERDHLREALADARQLRADLSAARAEIQRLTGMLETTTITLKETEAKVVAEHQRYQLAHGAEVVARAEVEKLSAAFARLVRVYETEFDIPVNRPEWVIEAMEIARKHIPTPQEGGAK